MVTHSLIGDEESLRRFVGTTTLCHVVGQLLYGRILDYRVLACGAP